MTTSQRRANKEVLIILNEYALTDKIPEEVLNDIKNHQDEKWTFSFDKKLNLEDQNIRRETAVLFSALYMLYICNDENEKRELLKQYKNNEEQSATNIDLEEVIRQYKDNKNDGDEMEGLDSKKESVLSLRERKNSIFARIKIWFRSLLSRNKR